ncbi:MAG: efflux RND transporter periplasmic adaptor subunit [Acidobacteriota bacterium]|nr:efflux RND transporter periplasmic adaptor subunit [Acidobacteriota bacterium]
MNPAHPQTAVLTKPRRRNRTRTLIIAFALLAGLAALLVSGVLPRLQRRAALASDARAFETGEPAVNTVILQAASDTNDLTLPASMQAIQEAPIYARTDGYLRSRKVDIGDRVRAGALLAEIESPEVDQQLAQARATQAHAVAALAQAKAALKQTQSKLLLARVTLERWKKLVTEGVVSKQDADEKQSGFDAASADADAAASNVHAAESDITAQQANVRRLEELHSFERVVAPFEGVITARNVDPGALITAGSASSTRELFRMAKTGELRIFVNVPQSASVAIHPGEAAVIHVAEFPNRNFPGKIVRTADALDPNSRTLLTEIHIPNAKHELRPGMFASVKFSLSRPTSVIIAPAAVFVFRSDGPHVALVDAQHRIHYAKVVPGRDYGSTMEILSGVNPGDRAVVNPADDLAEGAAVTLAADQK